MTGSRMQGGITRREFHRALAGAAMAALAAGRTRAAEAAGAAGGLSDDGFLNRLSFGATPESRRQLARLGRRGWLEAQLAMKPGGGELRRALGRVRLWIEYEAGRSDPDEDTGRRARWKAVAESRPLQWLDATPEELAVLLDPAGPWSWAEKERPAREVRIAALVRATHEPAQLNEVMTQFWHDHFNVNSDKDELISTLFVLHDQGLRANALGNFRTLLGHVTHGPAMLRYLDNDESRASPANENHARELMELHTLGAEHYFNDRYESWREVPGAGAGLAQGYIDDDVYEAARALTGWSIGDGRRLDEGRAPRNGRFNYVESWHDPYQKRILGVEFPAFAPPMADGERLLDLLAAHPGTARFVTGKIIRHLGLETPGEGLREAAARAFLAHRHSPDQIARVLRVIVAHPEFSATPPGKLRRPFEFLVALYRASGARVAPRDDDILWPLAQAGWHLHRVRPPTGHSDATADWADTRTIVGMINLALDAHGDYLRTAQSLNELVPESVRDLGALRSHWAGRFGVGVHALDPVLGSLGIGLRDPLPVDEPDRLEWINTALVASAAFQPAFLYR